MNDINYSELKAYEFRRLFVRVQRDEKSSVCIVLLDMNFLTSFISTAQTQEAFDQDCEDFLESEKYNEAIKQTH